MQKKEVKALINEQIVDNTSGSITAEVLNSILQNMLYAEQDSSYGGVCESSSPTLPSNSTSISVTTSTDGIGATQSSAGVTCGKIDVDGIEKNIVLTSASMTLGFTVDDSDITLSGFQASGKKVTINNPSGATISYVEINNIS